MVGGSTRSNSMKTKDRPRRRNRRRKNSLSRSLRAMKKAALQAKLGQEGFAARLVGIEGILSKYNGRLTYPCLADERYQRRFSGDGPEARLEQFVVKIPPATEYEEEIELVLPAKNLEVVEDVLKTKIPESMASSLAKGKGVIVASGMQSTISNFAGLLRTAIKQKGIDAVFGLFDSDNSGEVDKSEFQEHCPAIGIHLTEKEADLVWRAIDTDGSGSLTPQELVAFGQSFGHAAEGYTQKQKHRQAHMAAMAKSIRRQNVIQKTVLPKALSERVLDLRDALEEIMEEENLTRDEFFAYMDRDRNSSVDKAEFFEAVNEHTALFVQRTNAATAIEMAIIWFLLEPDDNDKVTKDSFYTHMDAWELQTLKEQVNNFIRKANLEIGPSLLNELIGESVGEKHKAEICARRASQANLAQSMALLASAVAGTKQPLSFGGAATTTQSVAKLRGRLAQQPKDGAKSLWLQQQEARINGAKTDSGADKEHETRAPDSLGGDAAADERRDRSLVRASQQSKKRAEADNKRRRERRREGAKEKKKLEEEQRRKKAEAEAKKREEAQKKREAEEKARQKERKQADLLAEEESRKQTEEQVKRKEEEIVELSKKLEKQQEMMEKMKAEMQQQAEQKKLELFQKEKLLVEMRVQINNTVSPRQKGRMQPKPVLSEPKPRAPATVPADTEPKQTSQLPKVPEVAPQTTMPALVGKSPKNVSNRLVDRLVLPSPPPQRKHKPRPPALEVGKLPNIGGASVDSTKASSAAGGNGTPAVGKRREWNKSVKTTTSPIPVTLPNITRSPVRPARPKAERFGHLMNATTQSPRNSPRRNRRKTPRRSPKKTPKYKNAAELRSATKSTFEFLTTIDDISEFGDNKKPEW